MRMVFTHGIPDNTRRLTVRPVVTYSQLIHIVQCSSLYRFQSVPYIRQCSGNDNTHGIINKRLLHHFGILCLDDSIIHTHTCTSMSSLT
jgi:hypothetical protein